jgi:multimeric flavodoxin WrbA
MKILAINGSPRINGNTDILLNEVLKPLTDNNIETEIFHLGGKEIKGCCGCFNCIKIKNQKCSQKNDILNLLLDKMYQADAIIIGTPTYFGDVTTEVKSLIDVTGLVSRANGMMLSRKIGAAVCVSRRAGGLKAFDTINNFFLINEMIIPGSSYWNIAIGRDPKDVLNDKEGLKTMYDLGQNINWLLKKIHY